MDIEQSTLIWVARLIFAVITGFICYGVWCFMRRERIIDLPMPEPYIPPSGLGLPEKNIVFNIMAKPGRTFDNHQLFRVMNRLGFHYGDNHVFEYHVPNSPYIVFSVINIRPPYIFSEDPYQMPPTNGLVAVMQLPVADGDNQTYYFHMLLSVIHQLHIDLDAELTTTHRQPLKDHHLQEAQLEVEQFEQEYINSLHHAYAFRAE